MMILRQKKKAKIGRIVCIISGIVLVVYWMQTFLAHSKPQFIPEYPKEMLTKASDYETIFLQTGLGSAAVDKLFIQGEFQTVLEIQTQFFKPPKAECTPLLGWFTKEDRLAEASGPALVDVQPGDILLTLSTHSLGFRHGHAGLVIDENSVLECGVWGQNSALMSIEGWNTYSNYVVLRVKEEVLKRQAVADYAKEHLQGVPYHLSAGFIGPKAAGTDEAYFGLQCAYLVWYAWNHFGYDLDADGGRLVLADDLLYSDYVEVVQVYVMDPRIFMN